MVTLERRLERLAEDIRSDDASTEATALAKLLQECAPKLIELGQADPKIDITLCEALTPLKDWEDGTAALSVLTKVRQQLGDNPSCLQRLGTGLPDWLAAHRGKPDLLIDCITVEPPKYFEIKRVFSDEGNQKLVFLANNTFSDHENILKVSRASLGLDAPTQDDPSEETYRRELSPMSLRHPNIINTTFTHGPNDVLFIIEPRLAVTLRDSWPRLAPGEAVNLMVDIGRALELMRNRRLVHTDIKPDNIGFHENAYVLLDFGLCRDVQKIAEGDTSPTGALKIRAPELLGCSQDDVKKLEPALCDVWSLGATVFNALVGHFPLWSTESSASSHPSTWDQVTRRAKEEELAEFADDDRRWNERVVEPINELVGNTALREILRGMLARTPACRLSARDAVLLAEQKLGPFILSPVEARRVPTDLAPQDEVRQLRRYLSKDDKQFQLLTWREWVALDNRLASLTHRFDAIDAAGGGKGSEERNICGHLSDQLKLCPYRRPD
jgi:serine/threonine protein kinase